MLLFHSLVCCIDTVNDPLSGFRYLRGIPGTIILKRCRYDLVFPCAVVIAVKLGIRLVFVFSLSLMFGKKSLVASPLVV